ncbi:hypothetical protein ACFP1L_11850 [Lactiplantibacillus nangangensis]|uniref:Uncharacterized protein n=1 Tax=Lactiplantibacillus nangangensis TaxID=2559917 RepID=A0ABW1SLY2_9LACO|nr:hypothetical protein [Lactiplantibacillus nangangensis]
MVENIEDRLTKLEEAFDNHVGNIGIGVHGLGDETTAGFQAGVQNMVPTFFGSQGGDILSLAAGVYIGSGFSNLWSESADQIKPMLEIHVFADTLGTRRILAVELYNGNVHFYNDYRLSVTHGGWSSLTSRRTLWQGGVQNVDDSFTTPDLISTEGNLLFDKLWVSYEYLGNYHMDCFDLNQNSDYIVINTSNNANSLVDIGQPVVSNLGECMLSRSQTKWTITRTTSNDISSGGVISGVDQIKVLKVEGER